ncbi:PDZ domain-containing protein 11 [Aplysia californica]|uniref:PDZ domain-containing protein 11 n=1 Tax=Aplysia californica TaxID=6500 RepID=A0ABM0JIR4_APLCA|nr:PDZ domain-containing protein 11 [Aplysia californica]
MHHPDYDNNLKFFLPRTVVLNRLKASDALGFNIRGGKEHNFGLYVSKVMRESAAANLGIKEGDQILQVNGIDFNTLDHAEAVKVLKFNTTVKMVVRYFPYGYQRTYDRNRPDMSVPGISPTSSSLSHR